MSKDSREHDPPSQKRGARRRERKVWRGEERPHGRRCADRSLRPINFGETMENGREPLSLEICF